MGLLRAGLSPNSKVYQLITGWWLGHPSEKYEFVNWDDDINPILMGKFKKWQQTTNQIIIFP